MMVYSVSDAPEDWCVAMCSVNHDVNEIALQFEGKGHAKAAGFMYPKAKEVFA
jgi:nanoRNase/pAp phosphatase (c-di-AMP/oligoRNAs hydrolase)